ncbi:hypothetical protein D8B26_002679 [Coccidioides posadasii str. Silveira]|uniref:Amine oxidase n=2 Tax=Coccidioides posadasii TaxID=199306 RepID=E9CYN3_COCPS|nr:copper methylamine oxidase [Coccidioides posadasii str. Silveira]KMM66727.1 copper methylamine oxidase [Coccidioides posadasii RMSCC 3488]QVM07982.1 hypothetical protein D8B26_002679 [Coccidioides posadasii str. Silveira]
MDHPVHPLLTLQPSEVRRASKIVKDKFAGRHVLFRIIAVKEPPKDEVVQFLEAERAGRPLRYPARRIYVSYQFKGESEAFEDIVELYSGSVVHHRQLPRGMHLPSSQDDMLAVQNLVLDDPLVKSEIARLNLPLNTEVVPETWPYGKENDIPDPKRYQVWFFLKSIDPGVQRHPSANHFAHPLDFSAVVDDVTKKVIRIDRLPMGWGLDSISGDNDQWQPNPDAEYATDLQPSIRCDVKPICIQQPEGVSFRVEANDQVVHWQKWRFHLDFNWREGAVLRDVSYDGRPLFYRLSLAEMTVPYADPRSPFHRKSAYDLGEGGVGITANNLQLGCDCLGSIRYFDRWISDERGEPEIRKNCICMHEVDAGIGWKHTNYRNGRAEVTRARELVIQTIMTISNYEYILCWILDTAGALHYEVRATGIMSVVPADQREDFTKLDYGIMVSPGVMAPSHQHIFCLRLDPAMDGYNSSVVKYDETIPEPMNPATNPYGVMYRVKETPITESGYLDLNPATNRTVKIVSNDSRNSVTGHQKGYKIHIPATQLLLADPNSVHFRRAAFADHHFYFTRQSENELYPAGEFPWQSIGGLEEDSGLRQWAARKDPLVPGNGVVWTIFGFTHNPRPEDWPVMPCEVFRLAIKPSHFFDKNPALDMPASEQKTNKSTLVEPEKSAGGACCPDL